MARPKGRSEIQLKQKGHIYITSNPAWVGYYKVGLSTVGAHQRVTSMNTNSPHRDFKLVFTFESDDVRIDERECHDILNEYRVQGEWFQIDIDQLIGVLNGWWRGKYLEKVDNDNKRSNCLRA